MYTVTTWFIESIDVKTLFRSVNVFLFCFFFIQPRVITNENSVITIFGGTGANYGVKVFFGFASIAPPIHVFWAINRHYRSSGLITVVLEPYHWKCITGEKIGAKWGKGSSDYHPKQTLSYFSGPETLCKISSKSNKNCSRMSAHRRKWFYNPSHCYTYICNGTDNKDEAQHFCI